MTMKIIRKFDPWRNSLCTCPPKYTLNPYTGCKFSCRYCYITSYIRDGFNPRKKPLDLYSLEKEIIKLSKTGLPLAVALSTDAYQPLEAKYNLTRKILKILLKHKIPTLITTKSPLILKDLDILIKMNVAVSFTITTLYDKVASLLEPYAPRPYSRIIAINKLSDKDIPVAVRLDPLIPSITDNVYEIEEAIKIFKSNGAKHVVASLYKAKPDNLKRIISVYPDFQLTYNKLYRYTKKINGYRYPDKSYAYKVLSQVKNIAIKYGLTFNTCRDGLQFLDTPNTYCDASHLLSC